MEYRPLADFVELSQGLAVNKGTAHFFSDIKNCEFPYPLLRIVDFEAGIHDNYSKYVSRDISPTVIIDEDTIVFTRVTCQCFRGFKGVLHNNLFVVNLISNELTKDYLFTVLQSDFVRKQALYFAQSSVVPDLNHKMFKEIKIPVPNKSVQEKIAKLYLNIANKIDNNSRINFELESMARTIYDYWFLQFDFPDEKGNPYKSSGGKMVWNEELKREIPDGWKAGIFADFFEIGNGKDHKNLLDGEIPVYGSGGIMRYVNEELYNGESVLIPRKGTLNNIIYITGPFWTVDTMYFTKIKKENAAIFVYYAVNQYNFEKMNTGTGVPSMTASVIYNLKTVIPKTEILKQFDNKVQSIYSMIRQNEKQNKELASLREFLLPLLMNGQVRFKEC